MQEEARLEQSLFEYRQKLTLLHCVSEVTCVSVQCTGCRCHEHGGTGWELLCVRGGQQALGGGPSSVTVHPSSRLPRACRQDCWTALVL